MPSPGRGISLGLRVDVDTFRGTREGVPRLLEILLRHGIHASFFFSVGPDNMGRHLWRLLRPAFLVKMLRSNAASLYGWDILLRGTLWPGPGIGRRLGHIIRATDEAGHEVGLHAWDHHLWQARVERMMPEAIHEQIRRGMEALEHILGRPVDCSAAAGWKCTVPVLMEKHAFGFRYNSDCRGRAIFRPVADGIVCEPQIPVTLPTYDEVIGRNGIDDAAYNDYLLSLLRPGQLNVLTIHAEVEGISKAQLFGKFVQQALHSGVRFQPLGELLPPVNGIPLGRIESGSVEGREGALCVQMQEGVDV